MEHIWSPWRMEYIQSNHPTEPCIFCAALEQEDSAENLVVYRGKNVFVILNRYPYTSGHLMVVPVQHQPSLELLDSETRAELMEVITHTLAVIRKGYSAEAFNLGANIGEAAGAGIASHVHFHVVPRWVGDTNFMSSLAQTRVLPETLEQTWQRIREAW